MLNQFSIVWRRGVGTVRDTPAMGILVASTIGATLLAAGLYLMALRNLESLAAQWRQGDAFVVYVADSLPETQWEALRGKLARIDGVAQATLITPQAALQRFRERGPRAAALVDGVEESLLPATIALRLTDPVRADPQRIQQLAIAIEASDGVHDLDDGQEEMVQIDALLALLRWVGMGVGVALGLGTALIVSNTVRLTIYGRRDEIAIWQLVGATAWFVRGPFLIEGMLWGLAGGLIANGALLTAHWFGAQRLTHTLVDIMDGWVIDLYAWDIGIALVFGGMLLGMFGSLLAVRWVAAQAEAT